jgi:predicted dehydrogenase
MRAGKPVYVEKPMARNYAECQEMLRVSELTGVPIWVAYYRRTLPAFLKAKQLLEAGAIGDPLNVRIRLYKQAEEKNQAKDEMHWHVFPEVGGAGHFFDLASHQFDYLDFVFGPVIDVNGTASNLGGLYPAEDTVSGSWKHESGVTGSGQWSFIADKDSEKDEVEIIGKKGKITLSCFTSPDTLKITTNDGESVLKFVNPEHISQYLVQQTIDELRGVGTCVSTGESGARTNRVLEQMVRDYYSDKDQ